MNNKYIMALKAPPEALLRPFFEYQRSVFRQARCSNIAAMNMRYCSTNQVKDDSVKSVMCTDFSAPLIITKGNFLQKLEKNEVCIDVHYAAVNFADILLCKGQYQSPIKPPFSPGSEFSGRIRSLGSENLEKQYNLHIGDKVVAFGTEKMGGYAERCVTIAENVWKIPDTMPLDTAAAIPSSYGTALLALQRRARIKPGDRVAVTAAAGSLGLAALDIAKSYGASVIGACGSAEKCSLLLQRGADVAINYEQEDVKDKIKAATGGRGVDIVVDCVGGKLLPDLIKSVSPEGRVLVIGFASGDIGAVRSNLLLLRNCDLVGVWWGQYNNYDAAYRDVYHNTVRDSLSMVARGELSPYLGKLFPMDKINEAMQYILDRKSIGKVLLKIVE